MIETKQKEADRDVKSDYNNEFYMIRVLIMDSGYQSYYHQEVQLSYDNKTYTYDIYSKELLDGNIRIEEKKDGIEVCSIERACGNPIYHGTIEIKKTPEGLLIINELPIEVYLESVVPSEMPSYYELEALKAQAVCARTYAIKQILEKRIEEFGADVDDSVNFQVYGNILPSEFTSRAVKETQGEVLFCNQELIEAYYFSTSSGMTSTDEIWGKSTPSPYLKSVSCNFDSQEPWSKWSVEIPWEQLEQNINLLSGSRSALNGLEIFRKNESGAVTGIRIFRENDSFELFDEYEIRSFLKPEGCVITEMDGTKTKGGNLLPSAYFSMKQYMGERIEISGKGYGHGVGMSQNAANIMAGDGYSYMDILDYFYKDVTIGHINTSME